MMSAQIQITPLPAAAVRSDPIEKESSLEYQFGDSGTRGRRLKELYETHLAARLILDHAAGRVRNQVATKIERIIAILRSEGRDIIRDEIIDAFRRLEDLGAGHFIPGRRGQPSRFLWQTRMVNLGRKAGGLAEEAPDYSVVPHRKEGVKNLLVHGYHLRPDTEIHFKLPVDLTASEVERLAAYLKTLPIGAVQEK